MTHMNSYGRFAEVYDQLMEDIPYDQYVEWITKHAPATTHSKLLDVGCGTGVMLSMLLKSGYEAAGLDLSEEMLMMANTRLQTQGQQALLVCQSMDELDGFVDLDVVCIPIDSINYLQQWSQVKETLKRIYESLRKGGQLFFDVHSLYKMDTIFMDGPFTYDDGEVTYIWHTEALDTPHTVEHDMTFFVEVEEDLFERFDEQHIQRSFAVDDYVQLLREIGFTNIHVTADFNEQAPTAESERIFSMQ